MKILLYPKLMQFKFEILGNYQIMARRLDFDLWINRFNSVSLLLKSCKSIAQNA